MTTYRPGTSYAVVAPAGVAFLAAGVPLDVVAAARAALEDAGDSGAPDGVGGVIRVLSGAFAADLAAIPAFVVAVRDGGSVRLAARGGFVARVRSADGLCEVSGAGLATWVERQVSDVDDLELVAPAALADADPAAGSVVDPARGLLPFGRGVVLADLVRTDLRLRPEGGADPTSHPAHALVAGEIPVLARRCAGGHPNPPERPACARCGGALDGDAVLVARPPLGRLLVSTGPAVPLDRPLVVGRKPRVSRVRSDRVPRLVTVPSPGGDISRSHLEVRLEGWHVLLVDLGSTNGSLLVRAGRAPVRLHPDEGVPALAGDVVELGDGVRLTFEDLP